MTIARSIDHVFAAFETSPYGQRATATELDALAAWPWPHGFVPTVDLFEALLRAMRQRPFGMHSARPRLARRATKVAD